MPLRRTTPGSTRRHLRALAVTVGLVTAVSLAPARADAGGSTPSVPAAPVPRQLFSNPVTPGTYTGLGFDQCHAPEQSKMDAWLQASPYRAVGIYISGASRGCREQ